jgi:uncharacterized protein (DUF433 family)
MNYVERRPEGFYLSGSRVPLDCLVREYWQGEQPESIRQHFPALTLEQVFGALTFYLANKEEVDVSIRKGEEVEDAFAAFHPIPEELKKRLERARQPIHRD